MLKMMREHSEIFMSFFYCYSLIHILGVGSVDKSTAVPVVKIRERADNPRGFLDGL